MVDIENTTMDPHPPSAHLPLQQRRMILAFVIALLPYLILTLRFNWLCDDAFISFRYAKNLAQGHGLRYNPSESPPVEGYSDFLWVLLMAPFEAADGGALLGSRVLSLAAGILLIWRVAVFINRRIGVPLPCLILCLLLLSAFPSVVLWSTSGLGTMPFALSMFLAFEFLLGDPQRMRGLPAGLACVTLILIRAEGFAWVVVLIGLSALTALLRRDKKALAPLALCTLIAAVAFAALTGFRLCYFGVPQPNTFYAKVGLSSLILERGQNYLLNFLLTFPQLPFILIAGVYAASAERFTGSVVWQSLLIAVAVLAYAVLVGGDFMPMGRFFVPAIPFLAILAAALVRNLAVRPAVSLGSLVVAVLLSALPAFNIHIVPRSLRAMTFFRWGTDAFVSEYDQWVLECRRVALQADIGRALRKHTQPGETLPLVAIGAIGYYSDLFIYDCAGLVNAEVARRPAPRLRLSAGHDKAVPSYYFLKYDPTYCKFVVIEDFSPDRLSTYVDQQLFVGAPPEVRERYMPVTLVLESSAESDAKRVLLLGKRKDLVQRGIAGQSPQR